MLARTRYGGFLVPSEKQAVVKQLLAAKIQVVPVKVQVASSAIQLVEANSPAPYK